MKKNLYYTSADGSTKIHAIEWIPEGEVKAVLQISHGMVEFIDRYDRFAKFLNQQGIYVVGNDHLGHGQSVKNDSDYGFFAHPDGNECVVRDIHYLRIRTERIYSKLPYFMMGHSMGSFLIRQYMMLHGSGLSGVIVMGTGSQPAVVLAAGKLICKVIAALKGWRYRSELVNSIAFSSNNKKFKSARTPLDWLTKDEAIIDHYQANPWCTFTFTLNGFYQMFRGIQFIQKPSNIACIPEELPILLVSGMDDPVGEFGKGVKQVCRGLQKAGIKDIQMKLYENDRHEILNETDYENVYDDIYKWLKEKANEDGKKK